MRRYVIIGTALALAITPAMAGGKSGGHASTNQNNPQESTSLNYGKVEWTYTPQKPDGSGLTASKRVQNKAIKIKPHASANKASKITTSKGMHRITNVRANVNGLGGAGPLPQSNEPEPKNHK